MENASELQTATATVLTETESALLSRAREIAETVLEPSAQSVDRSGQPPLDNLRALAEVGLVAITTPVEWGGSACSGAFQREFTELLTSACGTTWFVLTQHLGSCGQIAGSENPLLREKYLLDMAAGRHWVGVGFGHLRRPDPPLRAVEVDGGWILNGYAPWVTGWPILSGVILGAALPDDRHLYVYTEANESDALRSSPPLPLCAMNSSATTAVKIANLFVPTENFVRYSSREAMQAGDYNGIAGAVTPALGCARGAIRVLQCTAERRRDISSVLAGAADKFTCEIDAVRAEARRWAEGPKDISEYRENALHARAAAITLASRAAFASVVASSGAGNSLDHPAQRLYREAMFYALAAQTTDIMGATLESLTLS